MFSGLVALFLIMREKIQKRAANSSVAVSENEGEMELHSVNSIPLSPETDLEQPVEKNLQTHLPQQAEVETEAVSPADSIEDRSPDAVNRMPTGNA